jgi:phosphorylcholine metabolism protein LicD
MIETTRKEPLYEKTEDDQKKHAAMLSACNVICKKHGLKPILSGSALLGIVRDGDMVPWSMGAVLIVDSEKAIKVDDKIINDLRAHGLKIKRYFREKENWKIRADAGKFNVEITGYYRLGDNYVRNTGTRYKIIPAHFFDGPLLDMDLRGTRYKTPWNLDGYLSHLYADWRTPNKSRHAGDFRNPEHARKL